MQLITMQPRFQLPFAIPAKQLMERIRAAIVETNLADFSISKGMCAEFFIEPTERRFWSPHLSIQVHDTPEGCKLVGRFSPRPEIWTMVMFVYFMMVFCIFGGAILGWSQWFVNETPWGFWAVPIAIFVIAGLHSASLIGQRMSRDQTKQLHRRLNDVLALASESGQRDVRE